MWDNASLLASFFPSLPTGAPLPQMEEESEGRGTTYRSSLSLSLPLVPPPSSLLHTGFKATFPFLSPRLPNLLFFSLPRWKAAERKASLLVLGCLGPQDSFSASKYRGRDGGKGATSKGPQVKAEGVLPPFSFLFLGGGPKRRAGLHRPSV